MTARHTIESDPSATLVHVSGDRIGDALLKLPAILAFKRARPATRLVWITARRGSVFQGPLAPLVRGVIDEVHAVTEIGTRWQELLFPRLRGRFDCIVATEQKLRNTLALKRVPHRLLISPAAGFLLSDRKPAAGAWGASVHAQITTLLSLAAGVALAPEPRIVLPAAELSEARALLPAGVEYIGFVPGAGGASKRWPLAQFVALARACAARGLVPVFFLGPDEREWIRELRDALPEALLPEYAADGTSLGGPLLSMALATRLAVGVANDCGGGHLLAAGGRPLISLFGHTDPVKFQPPYGPRTAIRALDYGGCEMSRIPVEAVLAAVDAQLASARAGG
jgi:ADP-heptose:LPS heptosyltransferase